MINPLWVSQYGEKKAREMAVFTKLAYTALAHDSPNGKFEFSTEQKEIVDSPANPIMIVGGVRGGKSFISFIKAIPYLTIKGGLIWIIGPDYFQTAEFDYMLKLIEDMNLLDGEASTPKEGSRRFKVRGGATVQTKTGDDLKRIASFATDCVIVAEAGQQGEAVLSKALERNVERGGLTIMSGTFEDALPWYAEIYEDWLQGKSGAKSFSLPTWSNTAVFPLGREDPKFREMAAHLDDDEFDERLAAVPRAKTGLVHKGFRTETHVAYLPIAEDVPLHVAIDPGTSTYAVEIIQVVGSCVNVVDEIYMHEALTEDVIAALKAKPYYNRIVGGTVDRAANQRQAQRSIHSIWLKETGLDLVFMYVHIPHGIAAMNRFLRVDPATGQPRIMFSNRLSARTKRNKPLGIRAELVMRKWPTDTKSRNEAVVPIKKHDHGINAVEYFLYIKFGHELEKRTAHADVMSRSLGSER